MTSSWEICNPDATTTNSSTDTSPCSVRASPTQTHYSLVLEDLGGPHSLGTHIPTPLPERGCPKAESTPSSNPSSELNAPEGQEGVTGTAIGVATGQENIIPLPIPPPHCLSAVDTAAADADTEVQDTVLQALMCICATASTETGGSFEDDLQDTEITLGFANRLQEGHFAPEDA